MTRNEALEKINKCIALATNAGATEGEKQNAWAMAEKLASKYGFKIVKQEAPKANSININTVKEVWNISLGTGINDKTHFHQSTQYHGSSTDFLGFDSGRRQLGGQGIDATLYPQWGGVSLSQNTFDNDWTVSTQKPFFDLSLATDLSQRWQTLRSPTPR